MSLIESVIPTCFKQTTIVPVPKNTKATCLNYYVALTSVAMRCFERLVMVNTIIPETLDPLQFAYRPNRSTDDAISIALNTALSHLDYSSAFNSIVPSKLITKLRTLGLNISLCNWILDFLTGRPQVVRVGNTSATLILNTRVPQGCVLSPLLYSLFTHDCTARHDSNTIMKFADDTTVVGQRRNSLQGGGQRPDLVVPGQQPLPQRDQDKGDDCGLQEKEDRARPHSHRRGCSGAV